VVRLTEANRRRVRVALAIAAGCLMVVIALAVRQKPYGLAVVWSSLMVASFVGWGSLVNLWLAPRRWADWGLRAGWGLSLFVAMGGFLTVTHIARRWVLVAQVVLGVAALLGIGALRRARRPFLVSRRAIVVTIGRVGTLAVIALAYGFVVFTAFAALGEHWFNDSDDPPLYFTMAEKIVQAGSLLEPFAARRVVTFGGHMYLEAAFFAVSTPFYAWAVDQGLGAIVTMALLVGEIRRRGLRGSQWVPLGLTFLLFFSLVSARRNTASLFTGVATILTLYRTFRVPLDEEPGRGPASGNDPPRWPLETRRLVAVGALTCVPILLRTSTAAGILPFVTLLVASDYVLGNRRPWTLPALRSLAVAAAVLAGSFVVVLVPWSIMLAQSSGALFYPFGHSNVTEGWAFLRGALGYGDLAKEFVQDIFYGVPLVSLAPFFVAGLAPLKGRERNDLVALTLGSFIGFVALARQATAFPPEDTARYYYAFVVAMALVTTATVDRSGARAALIAACLGMQLGVTRDGLYRTTASELDKARKACDEDKDRQAYEAITQQYRDIQEHIPPGATMVTAVNENDRFDFSRNSVFELDTLGGMGPKPGWPVRQGAEALARYLVASGVQYIVWVDFDRGSNFYRRTVWREHMARPDFKTSYLAGIDTLQVDAADAIDKLVGIRRVVYRANSMTVVDLAAPPDRAPAK
jgi:hypothetical protein